MPLMEHLHKMKKWIIGALVGFIILLFFLFSLSSEIKYGYIDKTGMLVIKPQFDKAYPFREGLAPVKIGEKIGFINKQGEFVIEALFDQTYGFHEGLAPVCINGKYGFINKKGEFVIKPQFTIFVGSFNEGLAVVRNDKYGYGYIDKKGSYVFPPKYYVAFPFFNGIAQAVYQNKSIFFDKTGKIIASSDDKTFVGIFNEGLLAIKLDKKYGFINTKGKIVIKPKYDKACNFNEGLAAVGLKK